MMEIKVPVLPESVADATVATWHKKPGDSVKRDENIVDIETDKVVLEVVAPADGKLSSIVKQEGDTVIAEEVIAMFDEGGVGAAANSAASSAPKQEAVQQPQAAPANPAPSQQQANVAPHVHISASSDSATGRTQLHDVSIDRQDNLSPSARRSRGDQAPVQGQPQQVPVQQPQQVPVQHQPQQQSTQHHPQQAPAQRAASQANAQTAPSTQQLPQEQHSVAQRTDISNRTEKRVPMTRLRARIADRLLAAQSNAAILSTFNEIDMQPIIDLRSQYRENFEKIYGVKLGFMSFFVLAAVEALRRYPVVNSYIDGKDIVYHDYYDISIAVSSPRGLVVPILRDANRMSMAAIEKKIREFGTKAKEGTLSIDEMTGGTFTLSNGGVFGSLMSTPILNPPQSAILGMHKVEERPVVIDGKIVIRPMMYVALSYDHRVIDGADSVRFLATIKEVIEDPSRMLLGV